MKLQHLLLLMIVVDSETRTITLMEIIEGSPALRLTFYRCAKALEATAEEKEQLALIQERCVGQHGGVEGILARISEENSDAQAEELRRAPPSGLADILVAAHRSDVASDIRGCIEQQQGFLMPNGTFDADAVREKAARRAEGSDVEADIKIAVKQCEFNYEFERITEFLRCVAVRCAGYERLVTSTETTTESYDEAYVDLMGLELSDIGFTTPRLKSFSNAEPCIELGKMIVHYNRTFNYTAAAIKAKIRSSVEELQIEEIAKLALERCEVTDEFELVQFIRCIILRCMGQDQLVGAADSSVESFLVENLFVENVFVENFFVENGMNEHLAHPETKEPRT